MILSEILERRHNYTSRMDIYHFTLRDYTEILLNKFKGRIIERKNMPIKAGYLMEFIDGNLAYDFLTNSGDFKKESDSNDANGIYRAKSVKPIPDENSDQYMYMQAIKGASVAYIGLSQIEVPKVLTYTEEITSDGAITDIETKKYVVVGTVKVTVGETAYSDTNKDGKLVDGEGAEHGTVNYSTGEIRLDETPADKVVVKIELKHYAI